ncbi:spore coat polysaccharide biosynthesis protein SpsF [Allocatelliglobosispora scoriae]|uniref:Spore coat polysaccharide biosynthesis protein SpsF n=1 Tax=Allocatelliglobosispora scoriae TaxID=643052 RepID=A0A841BST5_9ACTN|nr:glycosyltransferase family protein [Allocatelliglobosispora scoriae]MBB5869850.1 spore coat polysaccharide biosynthesis protein SpsF [Allocatelliglobosispora scoriae]
MRMLGVIQARMGSTRLPGKVLHPLAGRTVLSRVVRAAQESGAVDELVVATTTEITDDPVVAECDALGIAVHRGPVDDVLSRFLGALDKHPADAVMRFTADCPWLDPEIISLVAQVFRSVPGLDYITTSITRTLPRGLDVEVIRADTLRSLDGRANEYHRTHVTSYVYTHPEEFRLFGMTLLPDRSHLRLTLDTPEDWEVMHAIAANFGDTTMAISKLTEWLDEHPEIASINAEVEQKPLHVG